MNAVALALVLCAGCGRIGFDARGDVGGDPLGDETVDGALAINRVFVTRTTYPGDLGGLAGADAKCASEAAAGGLSGTFVALLSTSTVDAIDRLAGSRGWITPTGKPVLDVPSDLAARVMLNPVNVGADGLPVADPPVWTGTNGAGVATASTCADWSSTGLLGGFGILHFAAPLFLGSGGVDNCTALHHIYCFEVGHVAPVTAVPVAGRIAFVSSTARSMIGVAPLDTICANEATAATLPGTYRAALATASASLVSRFTIDNRSWIRVDGTLVADGGNALFDGSPRHSFVNQNAVGGFASSVLYFSGVTSPTMPGTIASTCDSWQSTSNAANGTVGVSASVDPNVFWANQGVACNAGQPVLCLQE
jgi:hypothetical protein